IMVVWVPFPMQPIGARTALCKDTACQSMSAARHRPQTAKRRNVLAMTSICAVQAGRTMLPTIGGVVAALAGAKGCRDSTAIIAGVKGVIPSCASDDVEQAATNGSGNRRRISSLRRLCHKSVAAAREREAGLVEAFRAGHRGNIGLL